jgi:TRAP transporter TAXI family solute receptor
MKRFYKILGISMIALLTLTACSTAASNPPSSASQSSSSKAAPVKTYTFGTSDAAGTQYIIGVAMAEAINTKSNTIKISVQATAGGSEDIQLVKEGQAAFGFSNSSTLYDYKNGLGWVKPEEKVTNLAGVMAMQPAYGQWLALKSSNIHSIQDLKGKRVCLGTTSVSVPIMSRAMLAYYGMSDKDLASAVLLSQSEACEKLADGDLDAVFLMAAYPLAAYTNLLIDDRYNMIDVPTDVLQKIIDNNEVFRGYHVGVIPAGTYSHIDQDVHGLYTRNTIFCDSNLPDDVVYEFCKQTFDNWDSIKSAHAILSTLDFKDFTDTGVPLHPGAEKYYKEIGLIK